MTNLPVEVLHLIFPQLSTRDQLECMTVCRQWEQVITHSLFRVVYIRSRKQLNKLIRRIKRDPTLGAQVERLILNLESENDFDETVLIDLFPNVREFTFIALGGYDTDGETDLEDEAFKSVTRTHKIRKNHPWRDRIEKIDENIPTKYTNAFLNSGLCRSLTHLSLTGRRSLSVTGLIASLDNTPALKVLELSSYKICLQDLESLHLRVPALTSIGMYRCAMNCMVFPSDIEPATSVKQFHSLDSYLACTNIPYMKYIVTKYTNLEEISFQSHDLGFLDKDETEEAAETRTMMVSYLKKLSIGLKTLSISLDLLHADSGLIGFDFDVLDESGCQIEKLTLDYIDRMYIYEQLANTTQVKYIQSLTVNHFPYDNNNYDGSILLKWLTHFTSLKKLSLSFRCTTICLKKVRLDLADLLDILAEAQVETLSLADAELSFNTSGTTRTYPLVKNLTLDDVHLKYNTDVAISRSLINLRRLTLANLAANTRFLMFPMTRFSYLGVSSRGSDEFVHALVMTTDNNQQRLYTSEDGGSIHLPRWDRLEIHPLSLPSIRSKPCNGSIDTPVLSIVCKSISDCFIL